MRQDRETPKTERRQFLKLAGLGAAAGAAATVAGAEPAAAAVADGKPAKQGYRETAHVRTYYELARF
jgi:hypothetical protein